jgi:ATP-binding cassette subfamily B protein
MISQPFHQARRYFAILRRSLPLLKDAAPSEALLLVLGLTLQGLVPAAIVWLTAQVAEVVVTAVTVGGDTGNLGLLVGLWVAALVIDAALSPWLAAWQGHLNDKLTAHVNMLLMRQADRFADLSRFEDARYYDTIQVLKDQASYQPVNLVVYLANGFRELVIVVSMLALLATVAWWVPLLILLAALPHTYVSFQLQKNAWETMVLKSPQARRMQYYSSVLLNDTHAKEVRLFGLGAWLLGRYRDAFLDSHRAMRAVRHRQARHANAWVLLSAAGNAVAFYYVVQSAVAGAVGPGSVLLFVQALLYTQQNLLLLTQDSTMLYDTLLYLEKLFGFLEDEPDFPVAHPGLAVPRLKHTGIELQNVSFAYPDGRQALRGVSMQLRPGETVALVGENGAGKSTVAKLLARLYDPSEGTILVEGEDLRVLELTQWRHSLGVAFQDFGRYFVSARENVTFADLALGDEARLAEVAATLNLSELVARLPDGWGTQLGKPFGGTELSGGEWQKLALARALVRLDRAQLLILDEPTASLDPRSEYELYQHFAAMARGKTTLLITHRLGSVRMADRIYVLKAGTIVEEGTHETLLANGGEYTQLWRLQAEHYVDAGAGVP